MKNTNINDLCLFLKNIKHLFRINWIFICEILLPNEIHEIKKIIIK